MYNVSMDYKAQIKDTIRNPSYLKVEFGVVDPQAPGDAVITDDGHVYYSNSADIGYFVEVADSYNTLEHNRFILDGAHAFPPTVGPYVYQGYVGDEVSAQDGYFAAPNKVTITFSTLFLDFIGLTFNFDTLFNEYPRELRLIAYHGVSEVYNQVKVPDKATNWVWEDAIPECNKIEIISERTGYGQRRFRLENVVFGILKVFTDVEIESATWRRDVDLINSRLPIHTFDFTLIDKDRAYDPELPGGLFGYLEEQQPINFEFGYELDDGSIEWLQAGNTFTSGGAEVTTDTVLPKVTFRSVSTLSYLTKVYTEGKYYTAPGRSLYDLATDVLTFAGIPLNDLGQPRWIVDTSLQTMYTMQPLPKYAVKELLQLIANAARVVLDVDRDGNITLAPHSAALQSFDLTLSDVMSPPNTKKYPPLQGVDTTYGTLTPDAVAESLGQYAIVGASSTTFELVHQRATDVTASLGAGLTLVGAAQYYAEMCRITVTGTGTITLNGKLIQKATQKVSVEFNTVGERCSIDNQLITSSADAVLYATWIGTYLDRRSEYEVEDRGFPELDPGDNITLDNLITENVPVTLLGTEIRFNGSISGASKLLIG